MAGFGIGILLGEVSSWLYKRIKNRKKNDGVPKS
jgi:hypothetical protein